MINISRSISTDLTPEPDEPCSHIRFFHLVNSPGSSLGFSPIPMPCDWGAVRGDVKCHGVLMATPLAMDGWYAMGCARRGSGGLQVQSFRCPKAESARCRSRRNDPTEPASTRSGTVPPESVPPGLGQLRLPTFP